MAMLREARRADIPGMHRVRLAVKENRLVSNVVTEKDYAPAIELTGRGWVIELGTEIVAFAIGDKTDGSIWALFVDPQHERRGYGRQLHDVVVDWLFSQGLKDLWLTTAPGTRAERFYEIAGWRRAGATAKADVRFERTVPQQAPANDSLSALDHF